MQKQDRHSLLRRIKEKELGRERRKRRRKERVCGIDHLKIGRIKKVFFNVVAGIKLMEALALSYVTKAF